MRVRNSAHGQTLKFAGERQTPELNWFCLYGLSLSVPTMLQDCATPSLKGKALKCDWLKFKNSLDEIELSCQITVIVRRSTISDTQATQLTRSLHLSYSSNYNWRLGLLVAASLKTSKLKKNLLVNIERLSMLKLNSEKESRYPVLKI